MKYSEYSFLANIVLQPKRTVLSILETKSIKNIKQRQMLVGVAQEVLTSGVIISDVSKKRNSVRSRIVEERRVLP